MSVNNIILNTNDNAIYLYRINDSQKIHAIVVYDYEDNTELNLSKLAEKNQEILDILSNLSWNEKIQTQDKLEEFIILQCNIKRRIPYNKIFNLYDEILASKTEFHDCHRCNSAKKRIRERWNDNICSLEAWERFFKVIYQSDYLCGRIKDNTGNIFKYSSFEWITKPENSWKILNQRYTR